MSKKEYQFIRVLKTAPKPAKKKYVKVPLGKKILKEFIESNEKLASIKIPEGKSSIGIRRSMGRYVGRNDFKDITYYLAENDEIIIKKKSA